MARLPDVIREFFQTHAPSGPGIVAVSGGADSVALLLGLIESKVELAAVAHFDHQLRGAESAADAAFVAELAERLEVPFALGNANLHGTKGNIEALARKFRYEWLHRESVWRSATWIATGHTANDQAETVLHRLIRGTGLHGLRGIAAERPNEAFSTTQLIRPILKATRDDVLAYLDELKQPYRIDSSNADVAFTRNRIRAELVPLLKTFNPQIVDVLGRIAEQATEAVVRLDAQAMKLLASAELPRAGHVLVFNADMLDAAPSPVVRDLFRLVWQRERWPVDSMTHDRWHRLAAFTIGDYPGGVSLRRVGRVLQLTRLG